MNRDILILLAGVLFIVGWLWCMYKIGEQNDEYYKKCVAEGVLSDETCWKYAYQ